jgi:hypothetical protein
MKRALSQRSSEKLVRLRRSTAIRKHEALEKVLAMFPKPKLVLVEVPGTKGLRLESDSPQCDSAYERKVARSLLWETALGVRLRKELFKHGCVLVVSEDGVFIFEDVSDVFPETLKDGTIE